MVRLAAGLCLLICASVLDVAHGEIARSMRPVLRDRQSSLLLLRGGEARKAPSIRAAVASIGTALCDEAEPGGLIRFAIAAIIGYSTQMARFIQAITIPEAPPCACSYSAVGVFVGLALLPAWSAGLPPNWFHKWCRRHLFEATRMEIESLEWDKSFIGRVWQRLISPDGNRLLTAIMLGWLAGGPIEGAHSQLPFVAFCLITLSTYVLRRLLLAFDMDDTAQAITARRLVSEVLGLLTPAFLVLAAILLVPLTVTAFGNVGRVLSGPMTALGDHPIGTSLWILVSSLLLWQLATWQKRPKTPWNIVSGPRTGTRLVNGPIQYGLQLFVTFVLASLLFLCAGKNPFDLQLAWEWWQSRLGM